VKHLQDDYESAALRHFEDALKLQNDGRIDNAGHLIGFAAECAIKLRIKALRPDVNAPHGHFPELLNAARKQFGVRSGYTGMYDLLKGDVFRGWGVNRRYESTGDVEQAEVDDWVRVTKRLFGAAGLKVPK
jgi:hypothetical protein